VWRNEADVKITPLDLSIAKAQCAWRVFEVKYLQYIVLKIVLAKAMLP